MGTLHTSGVWVAKPGRDNELIECWRALAVWAAQEFPDAGRPMLMRDLDVPGRYLSIGSWPSHEAIAAFREHPEFARLVGELRGVLEEFTAKTYETVVEM